MSAMFERIASRFFGTAKQYPKKHTEQTTSFQILQFKVNKKVKKQVRIQEEHNEVYIIAAVDDFIDAKKAEHKEAYHALKMRLRSIEQKPFVPPVGTVLQAISKHRHILCAVVVMPDHRLVEVQRGSAVGIQLQPRFIFNTPYEWQCWVNKL
jgi:hypothetical protein